MWVVAFDARLMYTEKMSARSIRQVKQCSLFRDILSFSIVIMKFILRIYNSSIQRWPLPLHLGLLGLFSAASFSDLTPLAGEVRAQEPAAKKVYSQPMKPAATQGVATPGTDSLRDKLLKEGGRPNWIWGDKIGRAHV